MTITEIRIALLDDPRLKAYVSVTFDDVFVVKSLKIIEGREGRLFLAMPSRKRPDGRYQDIFHPIHQDFRNRLEEAVLSEYSRCLRAGTRVSGGEVPPPS
jgi:stage V sporulation protein G